MRWKPLVIILISIILLITIFFSYPKFFILKPFAFSGGIGAIPQDKICECKGISYEYQPACPDCFKEYYCMGALSSCKCNNLEKYNEFIISIAPEKNYTNFNEYIGDLEAYSYSSCEP